MTASHDLQAMQSGCRRILAAVSVAWGHPEGWRFHVEFFEDTLLFKLIAQKRVGNNVYQQMQEFTWEEIVHHPEDAVTEVIIKKVLRAYQQALLAIGGK